MSRFIRSRRLWMQSTVIIRRRIASSFVFDPGRPRWRRCMTRNSRRGLWPLALRSLFSPLKETRHKLPAEDSKTKDQRPTKPQVAKAQDVRLAIWITQPVYRNPNPKRPSAPVVDPVCGMTVKPDSAAGSFVYDNETYYFCSKHCLQKFRQEPGAIHQKSC